MKKILIIVTALFAMVGWYVYTAYNSLVRSNERVLVQWSQVETQYQRRFDLVPNLVASVEGVLTQEKSIFGELARARTAYGSATSGEGKVAAANALEGVLGRLLVIVENYPTLKSSDTVQVLMSQLEGAENRIAVERERYNSAVQLYNIDIKRFPLNVLAGFFAFQAHTYFEAEKGAATAPKVSL